ncbi:hypothetical protein B0J14DRAFT_340619 [Halenospora varia]|nr:hypothetical protein B0J14DRAFT_340619 [Halenospora varia]
MSGASLFRSSGSLMSYHCISATSGENMAQDTEDVPSKSGSMLGPATRYHLPLPRELRNMILRDCLVSAEPLTFLRVRGHIEKRKYKISFPEIGKNFTTLALVSRQFCEESRTIFLHENEWMIQFGTFDFDHWWYLDVFEEEEADNERYPIIQYLIRFCGVETMRRMQRLRIEIVQDTQMEEVRTDVETLVELVGKKTKYLKLVVDLTNMWCFCSVDLGTELCQSWLHSALEPLMSLRGVQEAVVTEHSNDEWPAKLGQAMMASPSSDED